MDNWVAARTQRRGNVGPLLPNAHLLLWEIIAVEAERVMCARLDALCGTAIPRLSDRIKAPASDAGFPGLSSPSVADQQTAVKQADTLTIQIPTNLQPHLSRELVSRWIRFLMCRLFQPNVDIRIAFSALLRIGKGGRYLLVRNLHRPETFGPFGGVYKYLDPGKRSLDEIQFKPDDLGPIDDVANDLRGFLPRKFLPKLYEWYRTSGERESPEACLFRELSEELQEVGVSSSVKLPARISLRHIRTVEEGPEQVPGQRYIQFRIFEVYEMFAKDSDSSNLSTELFCAASKNRDLLMANAEEVLRGRAQGNQIIGHHAAYLLGSRRVRGEDPPIVRRVSREARISH